MKSFFTLLLAVSVIILHAQPGTLDNTYGTNKTGTVSVSNLLYTGAAAIQFDNKLIVGGTPLTLQSNDFILARHNIDGSLDTSFGTKGQVSTAIADLVKNIRQAFGWTSIAVQPDGKIVAAGNIGWDNPDYPPFYQAPYDIDIVVARFLPDGTPDESFGSGGRVVTNLGYLENVSSVAVQPDGKIVVAGDQTTDFSDGNSKGILVVRYKPDGSLDPGFDGGLGYALYNHTGSYGYAMLLQPDGNIVVGGSQIGNNTFLTLRYLPDGTLDGSFGSGGAVITSFGSGIADAKITSLSLDDKQRISAVGVINYNESLVVTRYLSDGSLDNSFNKGGKVTLHLGDVSYSNGNNLLSQPDNKLVVSSCIIGSNDTLLREALTGLNEDGSLDASFGTNKGQTITDVGLTDDASVDAVMQSDGKIIITGNDYNYIADISTYLLSRFNGYPVHVSLAVRIKRFVHNHGITWNGLPAEDKIAFYSVEQSNSNRTGFLPIAKLSGRSNLPDYSFTNSQLLQGTNYYRIKAVSTDGTIRYSEVVSADNITNSASVYPNPASNTITVKGLPDNETANISIKDGSGTVLSKGVSNGSTQYRSSLANLQPGTYYVNITTATKTETLKFVKE